MKKLIALLMALILALGGGFAFAEEDDEASHYTYKDLTDADGNYLGYEEYYDGTLTAKSLRTVNDDGTVSWKWYNYDSEGNVIWYGNSRDAYGEYTSTSYDEKGNKRYEYKYNSKDDVSTSVSYYETGSVEYINVWSDGYDVYLKEDGSLYTDANYTSSYGNTYYDPAKEAWFNAETGEQVGAPGNLSDIIARGLDLLGEKAAAKKKVDPIWYGNNTAGVVGISLREWKPTLTQKWYNVLPVDISRDGTQTFPMVASNLYYMGNVTVTVKGDDVTVTYAYPSRQGFQIYGQDECLAWFTTIEDITSSFLENPTSDLAFGKAVSKEKDLMGQDTALLFICNHLNYRVPFDSKGTMPTRYWPNSSRIADYRANVKALQARVEEDHAATLAAAETATATDIPETEANSTDLTETTETETTEATTTDIT